MAIQLAADVAESDFAWTVGSLCQISRIPFDPALLLQKLSAYVASRAAIGKKCCPPGSFSSDV